MMTADRIDSLEMLKRLVAFDTTSRNSNLELIQYIQAYLDDHGVASTWGPNAEGTKANLYATVGPQAEGGIFCARGIPMVICSPGDISQAHQPNEFVARSQMDACDAFLGKMIGWAERQ